MFSEFIFTLLWKFRKITGWKGGFSLPVLLFVDIWFIFCQTSHLLQLLPCWECEGSAQEGMFHISELCFWLLWCWIIITVALPCSGLFKQFCVCFLSRGWWHRQIGITFMACVSSSLSAFLFFFFFLLSLHHILL